MWQRGDKGDNEWRFCPKYSLNTGAKVREFLLFLRVSVFTKILHGGCEAPGSKGRRCRLRGSEVRASKYNYGHRGWRPYHAELQSNMVYNVNQFDLLSNSIWFTLQIKLIYNERRHPLQRLPLRMAKVSGISCWWRCRIYQSVSLSVSHTTCYLSVRYALSLIDWQIFLNCKNLGILF